MSSDLDEITFADLSRFQKKREIPPFPLVAIVGQQSMKRMLLLHASNPGIGNIMLVGEAGIGKSTAARGLKDILPVTEAITGCFYNCHPRDKKTWCMDCKSSVDELSHFPTRIPLLELPIGASEKRIFGGFDHKSRLKPGFVGRSNHGYLIVPKANLVDPAILNKLLDISEAGIHHSKSESGDFTHPADFKIIATMNPEDGELDPDVLQRFSMVLNVKAIKDIEERIEIVRRVEAYRLAPEDFVYKNRREMEAFCTRVTRARDLVKRADMPKKVEAAIDKTLKKMEQDEDWVKVALIQAALANAAFNDRVWVTIDDVAEVAELVLGHRVEQDD